MPRAARRYDLYLPLTDNDGRPFADELFRDVQRRLLARFRGLTALQRNFPLQGIWQGETRLYLDLVIIMTVLDFRRQGSTRFFAQLKQALLREFEQLEILITEQPLRVHYRPPGSCRAGKGFAWPDRPLLVRRP
jgi:hypothetical protein